MPWQSEDALKHTKKATTKKLRDQWRDVANSELSQHGDEAAAVRAANGVIKKHHEHHQMAKEAKRK